MTNRTHLALCFAALLARPAAASAQALDTSNCPVTCTQLASYGGTAYQWCKLDYRQCPQIRNGSDQWRAQSDFCRDRAENLPNAGGRIWDLVSFDSDDERRHLGEETARVMPTPTTPWPFVTALRRHSATCGNAWYWDSVHASVPVQPTWWAWGPTCWAYNVEDLYATYGVVQQYRLEGGRWVAHYIASLAQSNGMVMGFVCEGH